MNPLHRERLESVLVVVVLYTVLVGSVVLICKAAW